jgi:hypothetical protein
VVRLTGAAEWSWVIELEDTTGEPVTILVALRLTPPDSTKPSSPNGVEANGEKPNIYLLRLSWPSHIIREAFLACHITESLTIGLPCNLIDRCI